MKKQYKKTYGLQFIIIYYIYILIPLIIFYTLSTIINDVGMNKLKFFLGMTFAVIVMLTIIIGVYLLITLIIKIFTKPKILIENDYLYYTFHKIKISEISEIIFDIGEVSRFQGTPPSITIVEAKQRSEIPNPPIKLIYDLKKLTNKKIKIYNIKKILKTMILIGVFGGLAMSLFIFFISKYA